MNTQWKLTKPFLWLGTASFLLVLFLSGCGNNQRKEKENNAPISEINSAPTAEPDPIKVLASPIKLQPNKTIVYLTDYIWNPSIIESISANENLDVKHVGDSLELTPNESLPKLSTLDLKVAGQTYSIPVFKSQKRKFKLTYKAKKGEKPNTVKVKGEFNNWNMEAGIMQLKGDVYIFESYAEPGFYQYVFVIDTLEITDPRNDSTVSNGMGGFNSVLPVISIDKLQTPILSTKSFTNNEITLGLENGAEQILAFWGNQKIEANKAKNSIKIQIPDAASQLNRSYIRCYAANENRLSNDVLIPLQKGKVITDASELTRHDHHTGILYNAFVDRFYDGDAENNSKTEGNIHPKANYHGGDIAGVHQKMEEGYFKDLGINTIWMSPVVDNYKGAAGFWKKTASGNSTEFSAYHGYWPISFTHVDERFGSPLELYKMVTTAHEQNFNVLIDFVANHVHEEHPYFKQYPDRVTPKYLPNGELNTEKWDERRLTTWFDKFMPSLDLLNPEVANMLADSIIYWQKTFGVDGFRHDATKHIPHQFWRTLLHKMKEQGLFNENAPYQIGETYGSRDLVSSYVNTGELNGQFDFNLYDDAVAVFAAGENIERLNYGLQKSLFAFGHHHLMGNISGNQDKARFMSYADGAVRFDEDAKAAGWMRNITRKDSTAYQKMALLFAFNFTVPGVPVIYYGDEIGMPGGNDPDNRRMMKFKNLSQNEQQLKQTVSDLAKQRASSMSLLFGETNSYVNDDGLLIIERSYFSEKTTLVINNSSQNKTYNNDALKAYTYKILKTNEHE